MPTCGRESGPTCLSNQWRTAAQRGSPNSSWSFFLLSPIPTLAKRVSTLGSGLPSAYLVAKFPLPSHLSLHHSELTKPKPYLPKPNSTCMGLWSGLGWWLSEGSGGGMVGASGSADSCWDPKDLVGIGSCCMNANTVSILSFYFGGREKLNENRTPDG